MEGRAYVVWGKPFIKLFLAIDLPCLVVLGPDCIVENLEMRRAVLEDGLHMVWVIPQNFKGVAKACGAISEVNDNH